MTEADFLKTYDPTDFPPVAVTVDLVLMTVLDRRLRVLLQFRESPPFAESFGLPGTFVGIDEDLAETAARVVREELALEPQFLEQLCTFGAPARDPRMRVVSVAYFALLPCARLQHLVDEDYVGPATLATVERQQDTIRFFHHDGCELEPLPFDHEEIIAVAVDRLRAKLDWSDVAFGLLPEEFTLRQLQEVHEAIRGEELSKPPFRKRMLDSRRIEPTGRRESGRAFRPAELYRRSART